jgi:transcriptional regulator with XRE-family HTH domain
MMKRKMKITDSPLVQSIRLALGYTQPDFAPIMGVSLVTISHYETGKTSPSALYLLKLLALCKQKNINANYTFENIMDDWLRRYSGDK